MHDDLAPFYRQEFDFFQHFAKISIIFSWERFELTYCKLSSRTGVVRERKKEERTKKVEMKNGRKRGGRKERKTPRRNDLSIAQTDQFGHRSTPSTLEI